MKIAFCDNRLGGLLGFRIDVIKHLVSQGHEVCLIAPPATTDWDKVGEQPPQGVRVFEVDMQPSGKNPFSDVLLFLQYLRIFRRERPDVVFNYTIKPNIYSSIAASVCGCRVICMIAGLGFLIDSDGWVKKIGFRLYRYGLSKAEKVLVLNKMNYDHLIARKMVSASKLLLLKGGEGVNLGYYRRQPVDYTSGVTFLMVSRLLYDKGYTEFVDAARMLKGKYANVCFEILGPEAFNSPMGVPKEVLERDCREGVFSYLGVSNNSRSFVSRKNVVMVLPSKYGEGLNRSLMEACAIGRPVITTDIPGCKETVDEGVNGFLVPKGDASALAEAMKRFVLLTEDEKRTMAEHSHQIAVGRFDIEYVINTYDELIGHSPC